MENIAGSYCCNSISYDFKKVLVIRIKILLFSIELTKYYLTTSLQNSQIFCLLFNLDKVDNFLKLELDFSTDKSLHL